jgi:hypothetical protein
MKATIVPDGSGQGEYVIINGEVERANPHDYLFEMHANRQMVVGTSLAKGSGIITSKEEQEEARVILLKRAVREWPARLAEMRSVAVPNYLIDLLSAPDKASQLRLLKNATITQDQLLAFILKAGELGYTYSKYQEKHLPNGTDATKFPHLFVQEEDGSITTVGRASASDGQMKQLLEQRKVIAATILDQGEDWHCFFATYRGLAGKENYKGGQPHLHYISSKWGSVKRQDFLDGMQAGTYVSNNAPHIDLLESSIDTQPPRPLTGTGVPEPAWLASNGSVYMHYYPANHNVAACGRFSNVHEVRAAWSAQISVPKPHCPTCKRRATA